ncbi:MAG TPA: SDR family oxidoreductase, partial [Saprospiraceae bacterium]|nr:SDR family oxidoreductase [Saprospiraceae bacterium]
MKILITGANGLLGQKLVALVQKDHSIHLIATARNKLIPRLIRGEFCPLDISNRDEVNKIITTTRPDVIINTAAMTQVDDCELNHDVCWKANVLSVKYLIDACSETNARLIHLSTDFIFDGSRGPLEENEKPNPISYYGASKLAAEKLIMESSISWCIIRTVLVYGITEDMSRSNIVLWVKKNLEAGKKIRVVNDQWRTPTLAEDLAMGCYLAAIKNATGIFHISGKDFLSPYQMAIKTAEFFNLDKSLIEEVD